MLKTTQLIIALLGCLAFFHRGTAQGTTIGELHLHGKVVDERKKGLPATIHIYKQGELIEQFETSRIGRFQYSMDLQDSLYLVVQAPQFVTKTIFINASMADSRANQDYAFPFFMDLYPVGKTPSYIDLDRPVGRIIFSGVQFIYDIEYTNQQNQDLKEFVRERRDLKVRKIEDYE